MSPGQNEESKSSLSLKREKRLAWSSTDKVPNEKVFGLKHENSSQGDKILAKAQSSTFKQGFLTPKSKKKNKTPKLYSLMCCIISPIQLYTIYTPLL